MKSTSLIAITCVAVCAVGSLLVAVFAFQAVMWHGAENYAALITVLGGPAVVVIQAVAIVVTFIASREDSQTRKVRLRWSACLLLALTVCAIILGLNLRS